MKTEKAPENWCQRNLYLVNMGICSALACICELQVIKFMWIGTGGGGFDRLQIILVLLFVLFPALFGIKGMSQISRLSARGEMSIGAANYLRMAFTCLLLIVYVGIIQFMNLAFRR
jgi:hypothetical protein